MKQEEIMQVFRGYFNYIKRPGADDLLQWMDANGFFEAPASKRHHGAEPGGLAKHSVNVFKRLIRLNAEEEERQESLNYKLETLAICGLLHDLCKIDAYRQVEGQRGKAGISAYKEFPCRTRGKVRYPDFTVHALDTRRDSGNQVAHGAV